jgi:hypothetical protein
MNQDFLQAIQSSPELTSFSSSIHDVEYINSTHYAPMNKIPSLPVVITRSVEIIDRVKSQEQYSSLPVRVSFFDFIVGDKNRESGKDFVKLLNSSLTTTPTPSYNIYSPFLQDESYVASFLIHNLAFLNLNLSLTGREHTKRL